MMKKYVSIDYKGNLICQIVVNIREIYGTKTSFKRGIMVSGNDVRWERVPVIDDTGKEREFR